MSRGLKEIFDASINAAKNGKFFCLNQLITGPVGSGKQYQAEQYAQQIFNSGLVQKEAVKTTAEAVNGMSESDIEAFFEEAKGSVLIVSDAEKLRASLPNVRVFIGALKNHMDVKNIVAVFVGLPEADPILSSDDPGLSRRINSVVCDATQDKKHDFK